MSRKLYIRADGNNDIGLGHIMRSMTIANEFRKHGFECVFLSSAPIAGELYNINGYKAISLDFPYNQKSVSEAKLIARILDDNNVDYLLVDSYFINNEYLSVLNDHTTLICINSYTNRFITDFLVNENIACDKEQITSLYKNSKTRLILGSEYSMIRDEFINQNYSINKSVNNILITTGGGDRYNFMTALLKRIKKDELIKEFYYTFVSGECNSFYQELINEAKGMNNIRVINNAQNMSCLMRESDLAISAGGTTVLELSTIGVPTIGLSIADDQIKGLKYMDEIGIIRYAGAFNDNEFWNKIMSEIHNLVRDYQIRKHLSESSRRVIDGKGAMRIYNQIVGDK